MRSSIQGRTHHIHHTLCFVLRYADAGCWFVYQQEYRERSSYPFHRSSMFSIALVWEEATRALPGILSFTWVNLIVEYIPEIRGKWNGETFFDSCIIEKKNINSKIKPCAPPEISWNFYIGDGSIGPHTLYRRQIVALETRYRHYIWPGHIPWKSVSTRGSWLLFGLWKSKFEQPVEFN
jgi:hypothetical protein